MDKSLAVKLEHLYMSKKVDFTLDLVIEYTRTYCDIKMGREQEKELKRESIDEVSRFNKGRYRPNNDYTERNKELLHGDKGWHRPSDDFIQRNKEMLHSNKGLPIQPCELNMMCVFFVVLLTREIHALLLIRSVIRVAS